MGAFRLVAELVLVVLRIVDLVMQIVQQGVGW